MIRNILFVLLLASCALPAWANAPKPDSQPVNVAEGEFAKQRHQIEQSLADGKTYAEISAPDRVLVREALDRMSGRLEGVGSLDELAEDERVALFNDQEQINIILTQAGKDSQMVCSRTAVTGSHFKQTRCETVAERRRRTDKDQQQLQQMQRGRMPVRN